MRLKSTRDGLFEPDMLGLVHYAHALVADPGNSLVEADILADQEAQILFIYHYL